MRRITVSEMRFLIFLLIVSASLSSWETVGLLRADDLGLIIEEDEPIAAHMQPVIGVENFERWVFNSTGNGNGSEIKTRQHFQNQAKSRIDRIDQMCGLTEMQKKKLELAAKGDMVHFFDRVEVAREKFMRLRHDQQKMQEIWQDIQPLQTAIQSEQFSAGSFFRKTLQRTLSEEQFAKFENAEMERRKFIYRAKILSVVASLETNTPMSADQREKLVQLIETETPVPRAFGQYDQYVVLYQMGRIPPEKMQSIFDESQIKLLERRLNQGRGMGQWLERMGLLGEENNKPAAQERKK